MVDQETYKLETELEIERVNVEILEHDLEIHKNAIESIKAKEGMEDKLNTSEIEEIVKKVLLGNAVTIDPVSDTLMLIGALTYKNYCIEDEKFGLMEFKENLIRKVEEIEDGYYGTESDVIDRIKRMDKP